jgi:hypothetical protein
MKSLLESYQKQRHYLSTARRVADSRMILAGYRLAHLLMQVASR